MKERPILDPLMDNQVLWERLITRLETSPVARSWDNDNPLYHFAGDGAVSLDLDSLNDFVETLATQGILYDFLGVIIRDTVSKPVTGKIKVLV